MLFVQLDSNGVAISASHENFDGAQSRWDWKTLQAAAKVAHELTKSVGTLHLPVDAGPYTSPRYDVIVAPRVGDKVSKYFNGDSYPEGVITSISASYRRIETDTGCVFWRHKQSGSWISAGTWSLTQGHHELRNPSF